MKTLLLLSIIASTTFAFSINNSLLKVHATLVPKIYLMDYKFKNKLIKNSIEIAIVYKKNEKKSAKLLQTQIIKKYSKGIKSYKVSPKIVAYKNIKNSQANIYYLLPASDTDIKMAIEVANKYEALTFSYLKSDLNHGVMISLNISNKIKPILNLNAIKIHKISLRPILLDISTIFIQDPNSVLDKLKIRGFNDFKVYCV